MKKICLSLVLLLVALSVWADGKEPKSYRLYGVAFYNLENLFHTVHE